MGRPMSYGTTRGVVLHEVIEEQKDELDALRREFDRVEAERDEVRHIFQRQWDAQMRGVQRWREANPGNDLVLPDHANLIEWLVEQVAERDRLREALVDIQGAAWRAQGEFSRPANRVLVGIGERADAALRPADEGEGNDG